MTNSNSSPISRRSALRVVAFAVLCAGGGGLMAQPNPVRLGALLPLTGSGSPYGQLMAKVARGVVDEVNAAGGIRGRRIELFVEDDETNAEAGVRGARKLIDAHRVAAIMGTWASAVTTAVAPLSWESKTFQTTMSGADSITLLPHDGFLVRTQPNTTLQGQKFGEFAASLNATRVFFVSPQTPFVKTQLAGITAAVTKAGGEVGSLVYDDKQLSYQAEVDELMRFRPTAIVFGGYTPDTALMLKDVHRAGFSGVKLAFGYAVNQQLVDSLPTDAVDGTYVVTPSSVDKSNAYARVAKLAGVKNPDPYTAQMYDQVNLVILALAHGGGEMNGATIKNSIRSISQGAGRTKVDNAVEGLRLIAAKKEIDYDGASGPCDFTDIGDIVDSRFRYEQVRAGKFVRTVKMD